MVASVTVQRPLHVLPPTGSALRLLLVTVALMARPPPSPRSVQNGHNAFSP